MPVSIQDRAQQDLRFIRGAMEQAERISAVSGWGSIVMGLIALAAAAAGAAMASLEEELSIWLKAAVPAVAVGVAGSVIKARMCGEDLLGDRGRRFLLCLIPPLAVGVVLTGILWPTAQIEVLPAVWMMLYGTGLLSAGTYAVPPVMRLGVCFLAAGIVAPFLPARWDSGLLALLFGGGHLLLGYRLVRSYGG